MVDVDVGDSAVGGGFSSLWEGKGVSTMIVGSEWGGGGWIPL